MKQTTEERAAVNKAWREANPEKCAEMKRKSAARMDRKRAVVKEYRAGCCDRKTDLTRAKGRIVTQCNRCKAMIDMGPEWEPFDRFTPVYDAEDRKSEFNSFGQYIGEK